MGLESSGLASEVLYDHGGGSNGRSTLKLGSLGGRPPSVLRATDSNKRKRIRDSPFS